MIYHLCDLTVIDAREPTLKAAEGLKGDQIKLHQIPRALS